MENFEAKIGLKDNIAFAISSRYQPFEDEFQGTRGDKLPLYPELECSYRQS